MPRRFGARLECVAFAPQRDEENAGRVWLVIEILDQMREETVEFDQASFTISVNPDEPRRLGVLDPDAHLSGPLRHRHRPTTTSGSEAIVVGGESLIESTTAIDSRTRNKGRCRISGARKAFGDRCLDIG